MNRMIQIPHSPNKDLRTIQHPFLAIPNRIHPHERPIRPIKLGMFKSLPNTMHIIRRQGNLTPTKISTPLATLPPRKEGKIEEDVPYSDNST